MIQRIGFGAGVLAALWLAGCTGDDVPIGVATGGGGNGGSAGSGGASGTGGGVTPSDDDYQPMDGGQVKSDKLDLLLVIDNSISMADKQGLLNRSLPLVLAGVANPPCVDGAGRVAPTQPASGDAPCPEGTTRLRPVVDDIHVGVITSSLGSFGGALDSECSAPEQDDAAHLVPTLARVTNPGPTYKNQGFVAYRPGDPDALSEPLEVVGAISDMIHQVGDEGCGFEATLEAVYRFLIDPAPPARVVQPEPGFPTIVEGLDTTLLQQRAQFLRPDSAVLVVVLSDENDCSARVPGSGWVVSLQNRRLPRATSQCATDPNDPCCQSCSATQLPNCPALADDPQCSDVYTPEEDPPNLRCFEQKRRFGVDLLFPTARYVVGLTDATICPDSSAGDADCSCRLAASRGEACTPGQPVPNPLFAGGRHPSQVSVAALVGVPWQDLADSIDDPLRFDFLTVPELVAAGRWRDVVGPPGSGIPPADQFMVESIQPRSGVNPATGEAIAAPGSPFNSINGHEHNVLANDDLQYACIMPVPVPRNCDTVPADTGCDCDSMENREAAQNPVCRSSDGSSYGPIQSYAKAYPGLRHLELMEYLGQRGVPASVCTPNASDSQVANFAHQPAMRAILRRLGAMLE